MNNFESNQDLKSSLGWLAINGTGQVADRGNRNIALDARRHKLGIGRSWALGQPRSQRIGGRGRPRMGFMVVHHTWLRLCIVGTFTYIWEPNTNSKQMEHCTA